MGAILKEYGECTGPFGFPMKESEARELDTFLAEHTKDSSLQYKHFAKGDAFDYFIDKERADVSTITDNTIDKDGEIVDPNGIDWSTFRKNPVVTLQHNYHLPPLGKSVWQKQVGKTWKAKALYAEKPDTWPNEKEWAGDTIWHLVKTGFLKGKSIGFLPQKWHEPTNEEISKDYTLKGVNLIFDQTKVFEYAVCSIGSNDNALVEEVAKSVGNIPEELEHFFPELQKRLIKKEPEVKLPKGFKAVTKDQYASAVRSELLNGLKEAAKSIDYKEIFDVMRGKV